MKRIITAVAVILVMAATSFSQAETKEKTDNERWLDTYQSLVERVKAADEYNVPEDSLNTWRQERAYISAEYKDTYKDFLSDDEQKRYHSLTAQYRKYMAKFKLNDAGVELEEVGDKVVEGTKKLGNKISGWFDGLKK